ncbi:Remorin family protein [Thalictrum thalictroides]|uniref:Remorin family protein n=1 Tax=Thalictrum thalictroides TaxID=46969 RepID=A0A7J6XFQ8_THATH|nr:Remorin family protein [Thalictrum thalictroides]
MDHNHHTNIKTTTPTYLQASTFIPNNNNKKSSTLLLQPNNGFCYLMNNKEIPYADTFPDPLCNLNLKETSEFVKAFPMNISENTSKREGVTSLHHRRLEPPPTPGRPVFSFSVGNLSRKTFPSKWDDAQKWLISSSCNESPAQITKPSRIPKHNFDLLLHKKGDTFADKSRVTEEKVSWSVSSFHGSLPFDHPNPFNGAPAEVVLKDKFTDNVDPVFPNFRYSEPTKEGFIDCEARRLGDVSTEMVPEVQHRDVGTEMTPLGSSTTSRCHTPFKISSPARHNTPADRSGPLGPTSNKHSIFDVTELQECHFAKLELGTNWSSREEEEEEISKSLRHFETSDGCRKNIVESRVCAWQEEERTKSCIRYQREEAKIQAWVNLQSAKSEAQSRKLEVFLIH